MKIQEVLFYLLILLLPTQLGKHFWPDWSMVNGLRIDYLSPTIYLTDLLILGILGLWGMEALSKIRKQKIKPKIILAFTAIVLYLILSSLLVQNQPAAFYKLAKLTEFVLLGIYVAKNRFSLNTFRLLLSVSIIYSSLLAMAQFLNQGSLGGIFWFLGERTFNAGTPGIAQAVWNGQLILRPYATFSHPNVLAGFLAVTLPVILWSKPKFWWFTFILGTMTLFLTVSRSAWLAFGLSLLSVGIIKKAQPIRLLGLLGLIGSLGGLVFFSQGESLTLRQDLNLAAIKMIQSFPILGIGPNNFLVKLPDFYEPKNLVRFFQPAHNLYLLIASEIGLIGLIGLICFLVLTYRRLLLTANYLLLTTLSAILVLGLFDHYFYTLQQGQLLFTIILGLAWSQQAKNVKIVS